MEMTGERRLPAPRARVWAALNDVEILKASLPGCRSLEHAGENGFRATALVKIGPIATAFGGEVRLLDLVPPQSYRIEGSGQGGAAGFAKGGASVSLSQEASETVLRYTVRAEVGGKLAQLGARLIDATARQMADQFFDNFVRTLALPDIARADAGGEKSGPVLPPPAALDLLASVPPWLRQYGPLIAGAVVIVLVVASLRLLGRP